MRGAGPGWLLLLFISIVTAGCGGRVIVDAFDAPPVDAPDASPSAPDAMAPRSGCDEMCARWIALGCEPPDTDGGCSAKCEQNRKMWPGCGDRQEDYLACVAREVTACTVPEVCMPLWKAWVDCAGEP